METDVVLRILDAIKTLREEVKELAQKKELNPEPHRSTEINELATALAKAQGDMKTAVWSHNNMYYGQRYADIASVVRATRPALAANGLALIQNIIYKDDGSSLLHTTLMHGVSGQWIESRMKVNAPKSDIHTVHSYTLYIRKMAMSSLLICPSDGDDDDGENAMIDERQGLVRGTSLNASYDATVNSTEFITKEQVEEFGYEIGTYVDVANQMLLDLNIRSIAEMPRDKYNHAIRQVRRIVGIRNKLIKE